MRVTIEDVAKKADVSITTVSRVMNNNYHHISPDTKQKVLNAIQELDYRPNALAKGLKQMKTNLIGVSLSNLQNPFWLKVLEGIEDACQDAGYSLMIVNSRDNLNNEMENLKGFIMRQVDGIIINPSIGSNPLFNSLVSNNFPVVFLNRKVSDLKTDTIEVDNLKGVSLAINHLVKLNRSKIALFSYPIDGISPRIERVEGFRKAMTQHGLEVNESWIKILDEKEDCKIHVQDLLQGTEQPNAIFSTNNMLTLEILEALKDLGVRVPEDIGILGYDETKWSKHINPALTTIEQPAYEMGKQAAKRLIAFIRSNEEKREWQPETLLLNPSLIIRNSCGEAL
ncbi:LacI family transcriptional regulator [Bacillus canaveralius]|nr:LacI family transcriptional regulator [Bacillus canaveralius]